MPKPTPIHTFFALRRSGHHAIMNWVLWRHNRPVLLWNNRTVKDGQATDHGKFKLIINSRAFALKKSTGRFLWHSALPAARYTNFEDSALPESRGSERPIVVLRDFYNNMASRLQWEREFRNKFRPEDEQHETCRKEMESAKLLWKYFASMAISSQSKSADFILYDHWTTSPEYRTKLEQRFGFKGSEKACAKTAKFGPGSSFEGRDSPPQSEKLLSRFEQFKDDEMFRMICHDEEVLSLNRALFGETASLDWAKGLVSSGSICKTP